MFINQGRSWRLGCNNGIGGFQSKFVTFERTDLPLYDGLKRCASSVVQCVAVCCSVLQCVAVCCSVLQCVAVCCSVLQCVAVGSKDAPQKMQFLGAITKVASPCAFIQNTKVVEKSHIFGRH